jgi:hypothetical protein
MAISLNPRQRKKPKSFWGSNRLRDEYRPLPRSLRYNVESLEPRYLLTGVALTNPTNDGTKPVVANYVAAVSTTVQSVIGQLSYLGQQVDKTSLTNSTASTSIPLLNQTPIQLGSLATTGSSFGSQAGNITFGSLLLNESDSGGNVFSETVNTFMTAANAPTTSTLAAQLQSEGQSLFGNGFTVTDKSSGTTLDLQFSFTADTFQSVPINIGESAAEYNLLLAAEATGSPDVQVETKLSETYDITANLATFDTAYNANNGSTTTNEENAFNLVTTSTSFEQSAQTVSTPLPTFGLEFGIIGAGSPGITENGVSLTNNSSTLTLGNVGDIADKMSVQGTGIAAGTTITGINTTNGQVTLSHAATSNETNEQVTIGAVDGAYVNSSAFVEGNVTVTSGTSTITLDSVTGLANGLTVQGAGIPVGTTISGISGNVVTLSNPATATGVATVTINATAAMALNEQMSLTLTSPTLNYPNIETGTYSFAAPVTLASNITALNIGTSGAPNTGELNTGVIGIEDLSGLTGYVGNLTITGSFTLYSDNLFDGHPALVYPGSAELANLARISSADIVVDAQDSDTLISELDDNSVLQSNVPFTSETLSSAYDFGTAAEVGFVNAIQSTTMVLTGTSSPGTYNTSTDTYDNTDLSGSSSFTLEVVLSTGAISSYTVAVASGSTSRTLQGLAAALENALKSVINQQTHTLVDLTGTTYGFSASVSPSGSTLQLVSTVGGIQFFLANISSDTPAAGVLNLGFNSYGSVALYANGNVNTSANYELPGVVLTSAAAVQLSSFETETQFGIEVNNGTDSTYGSGYITVSLAAGSYTQNTLVAALTTALQQSLLNDGFDTDGVMVRSFALGSGFGLQFYGGDDVYQLAIENISTPGSSLAIGKFQLATDTSVTAPYFDLSINGATATPVYINGNFTTGLLDNLAPAGSLNDLVNDLQLALIASGALSADESTGITVSSTATSNGNELVFSAANPGSGTGQISEFSITSESGLDSLNLLGSGTNSSMHWALGASQTEPAFVTIQDLETLLIQKGVMQGGTYGDYDETDETFTFPLNFTVTSSGNPSDFPTLSVPLSFATPYGSVSNLESSSSVNLNRSDTLQFDFGFNVTPQTEAGEVLTADLPIVIPFWDMTAYQSLESTSPLVFEISTNDGVAHTLQLNQVPESDGTSEFYSSTDNISTATDFITALNKALTEAGLQITATFSPEDGYGRTQIVLTTTAGAYSELVVTVPPTSSGVMSVPDSAWNNLGFAPTTGTATTSTLASDTNNEITGPGDLQFVVVDGNSTIPNEGSFYVTLPDGTNSGFSLNPANLPSNAATADVINELSYEIASNTSLLGSSFGAIGLSTLTMNLTSGSTTATLSNVIDPTPYLVGGTNNVGPGYGLTVGMALTGAGIAANTTIQSITYDSSTKKVSIGLSNAATSSTTHGTTVTVQPVAGAAEYNIIPKLIPTALVNGQNTQIVFTLNPAVFGPGVQSWSLQVASTYLEQLDNPASLELGIPASTVTDTTVPMTGITSTVITSNTFSNWSSSTPASFQVSINGSSYVTVTLNKSALPSDTIAGLISALNTAFAATTINLSVPGAPVTTTYHLSDFLAAQATDGGTNVIISLISGSTAVPAVSGARFALTSGANVMNNPAVLGFFPASGTTEYLFGQRGAEAVVNAPVLSGTLTVSNGDFTGTAQFGFVNFDINGGVLNETIDLIFSDSSSNSSILLDLDQATADAGNISSTLYGDYAITVQSTTTADALLGTLSFPDATGITNLAFGNNATIDILYPLSTATGATGHYITDFSNLPPPEVTYTNTNGMQLLTRLSFSDIANGLIQIGNLVSNWMNTDLNDPFSSSLLYSKQSLVQIDDVGADFAALIQQIELQPAASLQTTAQVLENGLGLPVGSIQLSITNTATQNGGQLALQVSFDWVKSLTQTLPLSVDLATMYDKASANNGTGQTPQIDLLGLNAIAGDGIDALNVILTEVSKLNVNLTLVAAQATSSGVLPTAIQTEAIINEPSTGNFFQTNFFLEGDNLTGQLPAGVDFLQLTNGSVTIDATGQTDIPYASQSSTGTLVLSNSTGQNTAGLAVSGTTNGSVTVNYDNGTAPGTAILIQGVTSSPFNVPVVNGVITGSGLFTLDGTTPAVNSQILVNSAGTYSMLANATSGSDVLGGIASSVLANLSVGQGITGTYLPTGTTITSIDTTNKQITLSQSISSGGTQTQGAFYIAQDASADNGLYTVTQNNTTNGYILTLVESIGTLNASSNAYQRFVVTSASSNTLANEVFAAASTSSVNFAAVMTPSNQILTNSTGQNTAALAVSGTTNGSVTVDYNNGTAPDTGILIQGVTTLPFNVPVVNGVITGSGLFTINGTTPAVNSQILVNTAGDYTMLANASYSSSTPAQNYVLSGIASSVFANLSVGQGISGSFLPAGTTIASINASQNEITLSQPISGTGSQTQGVFFVQQNASSVNGLYTVTQNNSTNGYILTLVDSIGAINASTTPNQRFVVTSASSNTLANQVYETSTTSDTLFAAVTTSPNNLDAYGTPFVYDLSAASTFTAPTVVNVLAASTTSLAYTTSSQASGTNLWTLNGNSASVVIDGATLTTTGQVILNHQANATQDGLYNLTFVGGKWKLTQTSLTANLSTATRYNILHGTVYGGVLMGADGGTQFAVMLQPASYSYNLQSVNSSTSEVLPYTVDAVTDESLSTLASYSGGVFTSDAEISLNDQVFTESDNSQVTGIDGVNTLTVGSLVLVKNETGANAYENGVYEVTSLGASAVGGVGGSAWTLQRADFAVTQGQVVNLRIAVNQGHTNADTVWVQTATDLATTSGTVNSAISAGDSVTFSGALGLVYKNGTSTWLTASINGASQANLPLQLIQVNDDGSQTVIDRDLGSVTSDALTALGGDGASLVDDPLYLYYQSLVSGNYVIQPTPIFTSLDIVIPSLDNFYTSPSVGTLFFNPSPGTLTANTQNNPPPLVDSATSASVLTQLQNGFYLGDALDLALFSIQSAMDEAMGIEFPLLGTNLNLYTNYVEQIRSTLTNNIRNFVLANPLTPVDDIRNALFATLGNNPGGLGYLTDEDQITVNLWSGTGTPTPFNFDQAALVNYVQTPLGLKNTVAGSVTALTFSIELQGVKGGANAGYNDNKIDQVDLGDSTIGAVISTDTVSSTGADTTGGVDLQTYFNFNFGFGVSTTSGFFIFNPTTTDVTPPTATATDNAPLSMIDLDFLAQLTGNINAAGITPFVQTDFSSTLQNLVVNVADGRAETDTVADGGDGYASFFAGDVIFDLNNHITSTTDPLGRTTTAEGEGVYATVDDLREAQELGPNVTTASQEPSALLSFTINADADIDLLIESQQAGLIPAIESDLVIAERFGTGAAASFNFDFTNAALIGLGDQTLGTTVLGDFNSYYSTTTADNDNAAYNALSAAAQAQIDTDYQNASPLWRFDRNLLSSNGNSGNIFFTYQNLSVDVYDYLTGPFFKSLINLESAISPLRPVLDFLTTPVPGTSWMPGGGLVLINLFPANTSPKSTSPTSKSNAGGGAKAASVLAAVSLIIQILHSIDEMLGPLAQLAATASSTAPWQHPQASLGGEASWSNKALQLNGLTDQKNAQNLKLYKEAQKTTSSSGNSPEEGSKETTSSSDYNAGDDAFPIPGEETESPAQQNQGNISRLLSSLKEAITTPTKYGEAFNSSLNGELDTTQGNALTKEVKGAINEQEPKDDKRGGTYSISVGISGGAFYLDAFSPTSILEILNGENANLLQIQLPSISATFGYTKTFPLPAFPPLQLILGISFNLTIDFNLGYDSNGFYWNTLDLDTGLPAPLFSFAVTFSIGLALVLGPVTVSVTLSFTLTVGFIWNDVSGTGVLHQSDIDYLESQHQSLFAVDLTGTIGFQFEIDLVIPLLFTSITIPIYRYTFTDTVFNYLLGSYTGHIQLGSVTNGVLLLNMGPYAGDRNYVNTSDRNEIFYVYGYNQSASPAAIESSGETVVVEFDSGTTIYYQEFTGVKQVVGYAGVGDSDIYAGTPNTLSSAISLVGGGTIAANTTLTALDYAVVDFYGGAGNVVLQAGVSYYSGWAASSDRSRLVGGTGTSLLDGSVSLDSLDLIAGTTTSTIEGSQAGGDNIVARQGSDLLYGNGPSDTFTFATGFGNDRIYVTGNGNSVNFSGLTLAASGTDASLVPPLSIAAISTPITFQFGQLVDDAVTANSSVFFAVDPSEKNSIDTWTGGTADDTFTVFFFAPDQTLNLDETVSLVADTFNVFLGDPNINYYVPGDPRNIGTINIHDNSPTQGQVFLTQLFSNTITYNSTGVSNGREQMTFSDIASGTNTNIGLIVSLDAPDSTLYWGNASDPSAYTTQAGGSISVGHLVLLGNVLLTSNTVITLGHSFLLNYDIDVEGGTTANPASIEFDLSSANPAVDANFVLATNSATNNPSRLMISTGTSQDGQGIGNIFLNLYTGSLLNQSGTTNYGVIELGTGTLVILALETIGTLTSPINVLVQNLTAKTTSTLNPLFNYGIFLYSDQNLNLTGYGSVSGNQNDNILGLTTVNGDIWVELAPTYSLTYYELIAGGSGNVTIIADHVGITTGFSVIENELQLVQHTYTYSFIYFYPVYLYYSINYLFFSETYAELIFLPEVFTYQYTYDTYAILPTAVTIQPSGAKIQGSGNLTFENAASAENIQVGGSALLPSATGLLVSDAVLGSVVTGFATLTIGRPKPAGSGSTTGTVTLDHTEDFTQESSVLLQGTNLDIDYSVTATNLLTFNAYDVGSSSVTFTNAGNTYKAASVVVSTDQTAALSLHGLFLSMAAGGSVQVSTGGNLTLFGSLAANGGNASTVVVTATGSITLDNLDQLQVSPGTYYNSLSAYGGGGDTTSEIELSAGSASGIGIAQAVALHSTLEAPNMSLVALGSIVLSTEMDTLVLASGSSVNLTNRNLSASLWTINELSASSGGITIDDTTGIELARASSYVGALISTTASNQTVSITAGGDFTGDSTGSELDISTTNLTMRTAGGISGATSTTDLLIHAAELNVVTSATGDVLIGNVNSAIVLTQVVTDNGLISFQSNDTITVDTVQSQTSSTSNSITLTTTPGSGGNINLGNLTGSITGVVDAGTLGAVSLSADGVIAGALSGSDITKQLDLITGASVSLTSNANAGSANNAILAAVNTVYLDAVANNSGQIQIYAQGPAPTNGVTSGNLYLHDLYTAQGNIVVLGEASSLTVLPLNFITGDVNAQASNLTLETSGTITENTNGLTTADEAALLVFQLHAGLLITQSVGTSYLDTAVVSLASEVTGTGSLTILARGTVDIYRATTQNGAIIINGDITDVASIRVGTIDAGKTSGGTKSNVTIDGVVDILDLNATHNNVGTTQFNAYVTEFGALTGLTAALFTATTTFGIQGLTTQVDTLDASSTENLGTAEMILTQTGAITIDDVSMTGGGNFALTGNANITVDSLDSDQIAGQLITLITTGGWIDQSSSTPATTANIIGFGLNLQAVNGILLNTSLLNPVLLDPNIPVLTATNSGGTDTSRANIVLHNLATTELDISQIAASHGNITLTTAGDLVLKNLPLGQSVYLSTPTDGASSLTPYQISLTSAGTITGGTAGLGNPLFDIVTDDLVLSAATSITGIGNGGNDSLVTQVSKLTATTSGAGAMSVINHGALELVDVETANGPIFIQNDANLTVDLVKTDTISLANTITLISTGGWIDENSNTTATTANIVGDELFLQAVDGILLNTNISVLTATNSGGTDTSRANIVLHNLATTELDISLVSASAGNITLTTAGDLVLKNLPLGQSVYLSTPADGASSLTPYQISLTSGGKIMGGTAGTGSTSLFDIVTDDLVLSAVTSIAGLGSNNSLVTRVSKLTATTSGTGEISVTNRGALELVDVETANGLIFIQNDAALMVDAVKSDTSVTANTITLQNTLGSTAANITLGTINAGASADVTVTSTGAILGGTGNLITGDTLTLTAQGLEGGTNAAIDVNVLGSVLDAYATGSGQIIIHTAGDLTLDQVDTVSGDIHITATGTASLLTSEVEAGTGVAFANDVYLTAAGTIGEYKPTPANLARTYKIIGNSLFVQAGGTTYLDTIIQTLDATVTSPGTLTVDQTGNLNVYSAITDNGVITITAIPANGQSTANIFIGTLTAGSGVTGESDVNLITNTGYIMDLDVTTITDPAIVPPLSYAPLLSGATFTATTALGIHGLHTAVTTFDATTTATTAYILIWELDDILVDHVGMPFGDFTLTAGGAITVNDLTANTGSSTVNLTSLNSRIQMETSQITAKINANVLNATAVTGIQAWTNINDLTALITDLTTATSGIPDDINIRNDGSLTLEQAYTPLGTFTLNITTGSLIPSLLTNPLGTPPVYHVVANDIVINTTAGIGSPTDFLSVYADEVDEATASISGGIYIHNYKQLHSSTYPNGFELYQVLANNGPISIISAGDTYLRDVEIYQDANLNDLTFTTTDSGNMLINFVGTGLSDAVPGTIPPQNGLATFTSAGDIEAVDPTLIPMLQVVNILAEGIKFSAQTGIGTATNYPLLTGKFLSASTVTGNIISGNSSLSDFFITDFTTGSGNLGFTQKGGGALHATSLVTQQGNIGLTVGNGAYLFLGTTFGIGNTSLVSDHINFQGGTGSIFGTGVLTINPDSPLQYVQLNSYFASTIYEVSNTLEISKIGFEAFFTDFQTILIGNQSSPDLTYMYYDVDPSDGPYQGTLSEGYNVASQIPAPTFNVDLFRVSDLFLTPTDVALLQTAADAEFNQILDTELNVDDDNGGGGLLDDTDSTGTDDFFALTAPTPAQTAQVALYAAHEQNHGHLVNLADDSSAENDAWIDQALVTTAACAPLAVSLKPKSWLGKLAEACSGRNRH